ncbi:hypothetical protein Q8A67_014953 [Cirrhinus molitorella]|uniref:Uncharacterized protein n=1 Tax=Cirrhinus molitorella TaxID=172907 RepID=A0AA88PKN0_9TELE|nr:hypothetical protein Q8A67_014953 [Cirrhinus molitorella]
MDLFRGLESAWEKWGQIKVLTSGRGIQAICHCKVKYLHPVSKLILFLSPGTIWIQTLICPSVEWAPER